MSHLAANERLLQLSLPRTAGWGGRRERAGRKRSPDSGVRHRARPPHSRRQPVHATLRAVPLPDSLREAPVYPALEAAIAAASKDSFRIAHFSVQSNHVHLVVEADDRAALMSGMRGLAIRTARAVNRACGRRGRVWADRYHTRALTSPTEVRSTLVYVLRNAAKHRAAVGIDPASSGRW